MEMENSFAVCTARDNDSVVKFIETSSTSIADKFENGDIWGVYFCDGAIVAEDFNGTIYRDIM